MRVGSSTPEGNTISTFVVVQKEYKAVIWEKCVLYKQAQNTVLEHFLLAGGLQLKSEKHSHWGLETNIFTTSAPRPIQSSIRTVRLSVYYLCAVPLL